MDVHCQLVLIPALTWEGWPGWDVSGWALAMVLGVHVLGMDAGPWTVAP